MLLEELLFEYRLYNEDELNKFIDSLVNKVRKNRKNTQFIINWLNKKVKKELLNSDEYNELLSQTIINQMSNEFDVKDASNGTLRKFKPTDKLKDTINHIIDWLNSDGMESFDPIGINSIETAYDMAEKWFQEKQAKREKELEKRKKNPNYTYTDDMGKIKTIMSFNNGYTIVQLLSKEALDYESCGLGHCVGHGSYDNKINSGETIIYSLRDNKGQPHATIEYSVSSKSIEQIKGKQDKPVVEKYRQYIIDFINSETIVIKKVNDSENIGLVNVDGKLYTIEQLMTMKDLIVEGNVDLSKMNLTVLPPCFKEVKGNFKCSHNKLTTLEGSPQTVGGRFVCSNNQLTTLEYCPHTVGGWFDCSHNKLTTLVGSPQTVGGWFICSFNQLTTLEGCPQTVVGDFDCSNNKLTTLEGSPQTVGGRFDCSDNKLTTLKGCPQTVGGWFICSFNQLTTLDGCPQTVGSDFWCDNNAVKLERPKNVKISGVFVN